MATVSSKCNTSCDCHYDSYGQPQTPCYDCSKLQCSQEYGSAEPSAPPEEVVVDELFHVPSQDKYECSICNNAFDDGNHRPRNLPCGHGFCTRCIQRYINTGHKICPICRKEHGASSAMELPVNFLLEELRDSAVISASQKYESDSVIELGSVDMCPKHEGVPLHFHCKTHNVKVCYSCAVIDHPSTSCNLISLEDGIKERKQSQIATIQEQKQILMDTEKDLQMQLQGNIVYLTEQKNRKQGLDNEVEMLLTKIEQINQEILKTEKSEDQLHDAIQGCQKKQKSFEIMENNLKAASSNEDIVQQCEMATTQIMKSHKWEETLRKELNVKKLSEADEKYAEVKRGFILRIHRYSKAFVDNGRTFIPSLSKEVNPPKSATLIKEAELGLSSGSSTVFMDLSGRGHTLGRVTIKVFGDRPHGRHFIMLALGTEGHTIKGAIFGNRGSNYIRMYHYVTESGAESHELLFATRDGNFSWKYNDEPSRGRLFSVFIDNFGLDIINKDGGTGCFGYCFGEVITGMEIIDTAVSKEYDIADINVTECGIILDY